MHWLLMLLLVAGCASMDKKMQSWMGHHEDELVASWGPPDMERSLGNGGRVLLYQRVGPTVFVPVGGMLAATQRTCRMQFTTDASQIVNSWSYQGC